MGKGFTGTYNTNLIEVEFKIQRQADYTQFGTPFD